MEVEVTVIRITEEGIIGDVVVDTGLVLQFTAVVAFHIVEEVTAEEGGIT